MKFKELAPCYFQSITSDPAAIAFAMGKAAYLNVHPRNYKPSLVSGAARSIKNLAAGNAMSMGAIRDTLASWTPLEVLMMKFMGEVTEYMHNEPSGEPIREEMETLEDVARLLRTRITSEGLSEAGKPHEFSLLRGLDILLGN